MDQSPKCKSLNYKTLRRNIGVKLHDLGLGIGFLNVSHKEQTAKGKK